MLLTPVIQLRLLRKSVGMKLHSSSTAAVTMFWDLPPESVTVAFLVTSPKQWSQPWLVPTRMIRNRLPELEAIMLFSRV